MRCLDFGFFIYDLFGFEPRLELSTRPEKRVGTDEMWDRAEAALQARRSSSSGLEYELNEGDGAFYGPEDRPAHDRLDRPLVAARHGAARLLHARALRARLHRRRQRRAPAGDDPPRAAGLVRALHRHPDRALRRRVPALAGAGAGAGAADRRPPRRLRARGRRASCATPACASRWTSAPSRSGKKIREAELRKVPYMLVVGDSEAEAGEVAVRRHREGDLGAVPVAEFAAACATRSPTRLTPTAILASE